LQHFESQIDKHEKRFEFNGAILSPGQYLRGIKTRWWAYSFMGEEGAFVGFDGVVVVVIRNRRQWGLNKMVEARTAAGGMEEGG
jgi:hypothetical protein